mmetsp:Transcript_9256/g.25016  ORF Transcript_9256/g.25016 Transcript_9256/m.25016 type:complete len:158 (-) Transcript_9256:142-615(-)|eukprot:CAMPEP_0198131512 /NCGR_PEP_ID=MMETSP1442-20131203/56346_1 /TAXON_ID= /ORGANISM="Craspedostauros australis, Strain CCMP3328" /LENGTH=157 /DNA_ID=CAMNT_0043792337 /DNA_START=566 /DNA_END=1039 /DNA_ORIENTATION=+
MEKELSKLLILLAGVGNRLLPTGAALILAHAMVRYLPADSQSSDEAGCSTRCGYGVAWNDAVSCNIVGYNTRHKLYYSLANATSAHAILGILAIRGRAMHNARHARRALVHLEFSQTCQATPYTPMSLPGVVFGLDAREACIANTQKATESDQRACG